MKQVVTRKDGITYERKPRTLNEDSFLCIKISRELLDRIKQKAVEENMPYSRLIRNIMEKYLEG